MALRYPLAIGAVLVVAIIYFVFVRKKRRKYSTGSKIANTFYLKNTSYYKKRLRRHKLLRLLLLSLLVIAIITSTVLAARPYKTTTIKNDEYNRDIILCMDTSTSVDDLNRELVDSLASAVDKLNGERFGISIFNTSSVLLVPLTEDYEYVKDTLSQVKLSIDVYYGTPGTGISPTSSDYFYITNYLEMGTIEGATTKGSSLIGDGLASCVLSFPKLEEEERTRIIIFSTDNDLAGTPLLTTAEAGAVAKNKGVRVFGIGTKTIKETNRAEFKKAVEKTGGKYYDHAESTIDSIVNDVEQTTKTILRGKTETKESDVPFIPFCVLVASIGGIVLFGRRASK